MRRFSFRFEKILMYRRHQELEKQRELAKVKRMEQDQIEKILQMRQQRSQLIDAERQALTGTLNAGRLNTYSRYYLLLKKQEITAREILGEIRKEVAKRRDILLAATRQRKIYEKLREKHKARFQQEQKLLEQKDNDELGIKLQYRKQ